MSARIVSRSSCGLSPKTSSAPSISADPSRVALQAPQTIVGSPSSIACVPLLRALSALKRARSAARPSSSFSRLAYRALAPPSRSWWIWGITLRSRLLVFLLSEGSRRPVVDAVIVTLLLLPFLHPLSHHIFYPLLLD